MMRSMYSGVSGLRIHQTKMDVIGNNIANVNTAGFKAGRVTFNEIFSQTLQGASGASDKLGGRNPMQVGLGANISSIDTLMTEGAAMRTDNALDMKIVGEGFFVLQSAGGYRFSRAGAFRIDEVGNLVNPDGLNVMGWSVDSATGNIAKGKVSKIQIMKPENMYSKPEMTEKATIVGNIDKNDDDLAVGKDGILVTTNIYDSQGYKYVINARITEATDENKYDLTIDAATGIKSVDGSREIQMAATKTTTIEFNKDGSIIDPSAATLVLDAINQSAGGAGTYTPVGADFGSIEIDFSTLTQFDGNTTTEGTSGDLNGLGAGNMAGSLSDFSIGSNGIIMGSYTNGQTKKLGQVVIAKFQNPAGLQKVGNNLFQVTNNSGDFDGIGQDPTSEGGGLNGGVLEMSNVDLSREFTDMITTQRGFQANSRVITSSDEMLQELVNLKR